MRNVVVWFVEAKCVVVVGNVIPQEEIDLTVSQSGK